MDFKKLSYLMLSFLILNVITPFSSLQAVLLATVEGTVTDALTTLPIQGATVTIGIQTRTTDVNGFYQFFQSIGAGSQTINVTAGTNYTPQSRNITTALGQTYTEDFQLQPIILNGEIAGRVIDASSNHPIQNALIEVLTGNSVVATANTNALGQYTVSVAAGTYSVRASASRFQTALAPQVVVQTGLTTTQNFSLIPGEGSLSGTVTNQSNGRPIKSATVEALIGSDVMGETQTDSKGNYSIPGLPPGDYFVRASATGFRIKVKQVTVVSDKNKVKDFSLKSGSSSIFGTVSRQPKGKKPIEGVRIDIFKKGLPYATVFTDNSGQYTALQLPPSGSHKYQVVASKPGFVTVTKKTKLTLNSPAEVDFILTR